MNPHVMLLMAVFALISAVYLVVIILIAAGFYKEPILHLSERYANFDDTFYLLPPLLLGMGAFALFGGFLFSAAFAPRFSPLIFSTTLFVLAYIAYQNRALMRRHGHIFLIYPRWYFELREHTTREERRRIAYMWLCLPPKMRLHLNGSDSAFLLWADHVILATVTQTVEDQEALIEHSEYIPDLHGRFG